MQDGADDSDDEEGKLAKLAEKNASTVVKKGRMTDYITH